MTNIKLITEADFCNKATGKPWVNRAEGDKAYDCWGLVLASFREIDGVELPSVAGYAEECCSTAEAAKQVNMKKFIPSQPTNGAIMAIFDNKGNMLHVGRCLCGRVLHSTESLGVAHHTYQTINNKHRNVRYFKFEGQ